MLTIGKIQAGPTAGAYYTDQVAPDRAGYYSGEGESSGEWTGNGAAELGFEGDVTAEQLQFVLGGAGRRDVRDGAVAGFDLTFRAPKSVSVLWAVGDEQMAAQIRAGHDAAVDQAMSYLEREACGARRGKGGVVQVHGDGFVQARFVHRTSRAGDPLLHTHVVTANLTHGPDERWTALDARHLYAEQKTAGYLYQAALREQLDLRLGLEWGPVSRGAADVRGVPREVVEEFSQRRQQILDRMAERGERSAHAAQVAALDTRRGKTHQPLEQQREAWRVRAAEHGLDLGDLPRTEDLRLDFDRPRREADLQKLTARSSTFSRGEVLRQLAEGAGRGASVRDLEQAADRALDDPEAVHVGENKLRRARYSTADLLATEQHVLADAERRRDSISPALEPAVDQAIARRPSIGKDQAAAVRHLTQGRDAVQVLRAPAGTGKTFALDAAREAWEQSGSQVIGCALSARAALELEDQAGIRSSTIARLTGHLDDGHHLPYDSVLVVDEAGMVGTRDLARLAKEAHLTNSKLVLVGDDRQLPEIAAGGTFHALAVQAPAVELREGRQQKHAWDREALEQLRSGEIECWARAYREHGRITVADTAEQARQALVNDWSRADGDTVMLAHRRTDVADLNLRARDLRRAQGHLGPDEIAGHDDRTFAVGDQVVAARNDHHAGYLNGQRGTVTHVNPEDGTLRVDLGNDRTVQLGQTHLQRGDLDYGYAITAHRAQGATVDRTFVLGSEDLYREWGYTALSRHREEARFYVAQGDLGPEPDLDPDFDVLAYRLGRLLGNSAAERTANEHLQELTTDQLTAERERLSDALGTDDLPDTAAERQLERDHHRAVRNEQFALGRIDRLNEQLDQTPCYKRKEFKTHLEAREAAAEQLAAAEIERRVVELEMLETSGATRRWLIEFGELAEKYLEVSEALGERLKLDQHVEHRLKELELPATRLEAQRAIEPPRAGARDLVGPADLDGPDPGP